MAKRVTARESSTVFLRPIFPHRMPVGIEIRKNQMKIIDGRNPAVTSESWHSALTWFRTVLMMSQNPITKNPASIGKIANFFFISVVVG